MPQTKDAKGRFMQKVLAADTLTGDTVVNRVAYAVLSFGGFLGMGDKLFAIPWSALAIDTGEKQFILEVDKKSLESAPGFDKAHWPDMADRVWGAEVNKYYGAKPYWA